jgi:hypothetical protein
MHSDQRYSGDHGCHRASPFRAAGSSRRAIPGNRGRPPGAGLAEIDSFIDFFSNLGLGMLFFFAGYEIDLECWP